MNRDDCLGFWDRLLESSNSSFLQKNESWISYFELTLTYNFLLRTHVNIQFLTSKFMFKEVFFETEARSHDKFFINLFGTFFQSNR
ncbi:hypothetical protein LEP1GSC188_4127 [Leptospira weilii serovar Topaz str. LT2116]|uniref:Uncharacterized protein n=1 Tax=Leptospira weilii serovar Topaz str. LT2116 TaxID=1088540 RepID=M3GD86_9LEPT|nr:hypothetical protein LEP1GSC188_4127 [Leptospira weilii serovar Topaz str. LT2116]